MVKSDPTAIVRNILESLGGAATVAQIGDMLMGDIFNEAEWKRWWESTKKQLKKYGYFTVPAKKTEPMQLRGEKVSRADELTAFFNQARQPKEQAAALDQIVKFHHEFKEPEKQLQPIVSAIENAAARNQKIHPEFTFELVISRDDLLQRGPAAAQHHIGMALPKLIQEEEKRLVLILPKLAAAREKRVLQVLPEALGRTLDGAGIAIDAGESRPAGCPNRQGFQRIRTSRGIARDAGAEHPGAFGDERHADLAMQRARALE